MLSPFKIIMLLFFATVFVNNTVYSQTDTLLVAGGARIQSVEKLDKSYDSLQKVYSPRKAIIRSAILPGYGQYTNKKYWKIPIIYGALGTTGYLFFRNLSQYKEARMAYRLASDTIASNDVLIPEPYYSVRSQPQRIATFRNQVRQNVDYSVLFFILFWGLNVVDASVDAHLKTFDVSDNLSFKIVPGYSPMARTNGISLVVPLGKK